MDFKRNLISKAIFGIAVSFMIGIVITIISNPVSLDQVHFFMIEQSFVKKAGGPYRAFVLELLIYGIYGAVAMGSSIVYELEDWSILKATVIHFLLTMSCLTIVGLTLGWLHAASFIELGFIYGAFVVAYAAIWLIQCLIYKKEIEDINEGIIRLKRQDADREPEGKQADMT